MTSRQRILTLLVMFLVLQALTVQFTSAQFFTKTFKTVPRMGRRTDPEFPALVGAYHTRDHEQLKVIRRFDLRPKQFDNQAKKNGRSVNLIASQMLKNWKPQQAVSGFFKRPFL